ncbi:porin family protein [Foetidibacter luteolus]|uniref:porin family protein n=1 Tax=Foetidibacter luteolus TaxID=2608880 RepID=UPI00129B58A2|nr:porin family protein [Foetidibacter luteolus]
MKKIIYLLISMSILVSYSNAQTHFGISAGISSALVSAKQGGVTLTSDAKVGFIGGLTLSSSISNHVGFRPELNFVQKGGTVNFSNEDIKYNTTLNYIEVPLNVVYCVNGKFFFGAGPSFAYGLSGKYKITGMYNEHGDLKFGNGDDADFKPFEFGVNLLAGWQLKSGIFFMINYNAGISNISATSDEKDRNNYLGLRIGYMFKAKTK